MRRRGGDPRRPPAALTAPAHSSGASTLPSPVSTAIYGPFACAVGSCADFDLSDEEALTALAEWNARCEPSWSEQDLRQKVTNARRYGREPLGGLL